MRHVTQVLSTSSVSRMKYRKLRAWLEGQRYVPIQQCLSVCSLGVQDLPDTAQSTTRVTEDMCNTDPFLKLLSVQWQDESDTWRKKVVINALIAVWFWSCLSMVQQHPWRQSNHSTVAQDCTRPIELNILLNAHTHLSTALKLSVVYKWANQEFEKQNNLT